MLIQYFMIIPESDISTHTYIDDATPCKIII